MLTPDEFIEKAARVFYTKATPFTLEGLLCAIQVTAKENEVLRKLVVFEPLPDQGLQSEGGDE